MQWLQGLQAKLPNSTLWKIIVAGQIVHSHYLGKSKTFLLGHLLNAQVSPFFRTHNSEKNVLFVRKLAINFLLSQIMAKASIVKCSL